MMRTRIGLLLLAAASLACEGQPAPLTAQRGSTVLIPVANSTLEGHLVGYGGTAAPDYQRGTLVYHLDQVGGDTLTTRGSGVALATHSSPSARGDDFSLGGQVFSMVDIPLTAPLGEHDLVVTRERLEGGQPVSQPAPNYHGTIVIMPEEITLNLGGGNKLTVTGQSTPFDAFNEFTGMFAPIGDLVASQMPDPELRLSFSLPQGAELWAVELDIGYDPNVIVVEEVTQPVVGALNHRAVVWYQDDAAGSLRVGAAGTRASIPSLAIVYTLVDGAVAILDPADVSVTLQKAANEVGADIAGAVSISKRIF